MQELPDGLFRSGTVFPGGLQPPVVTTISNSNMSPIASSNSNELGEHDAALVVYEGKPNITVVHSATDLILAAIGGSEHIELRSHALFTSTPTLSEQLSHHSAQGIDFSIPPTVKSIRVRPRSIPLCSYCTSSLKDFLQSRVL